MLVSLVFLAPRLVRSRELEISDADGSKRFPRSRFKCFAISSDLYETERDYCKRTYNVEFFMYLFYLQFYLRFGIFFSLWKFRAANCFRTVWDWKFENLGNLNSGNANKRQNVIFEYKFYFERILILWVSRNSRCAVKIIIAYTLLVITTIQL